MEMRERKVYDCFLMRDEHSILELRLAELYPVVDYFVLVESTLTHQRRPKTLYFKQAKHHFEKWADKIRHVVITDSPAEAQSKGIYLYDLEIHERNAVIRGLDDAADDDLILISDIDEIPRPEIVAKLREEEWTRQQPFHLILTHYVYNLNTVETTGKGWDLSFGSPYRLLKQHSAQALRLGLDHDYRRIPDAGWHLSWFGGVEIVRRKIETICEIGHNVPEFKTTEHIEKCMNEPCDPFERHDAIQLRFSDDETNWPETVRRQIGKYKTLRWIR